MRILYLFLLSLFCLKMNHPAFLKQAGGKAVTLLKNLYRRHPIKMGLLTTIAAYNVLHDSFIFLLPYLKKNGTKLKIKSPSDYHILMPFLLFLGRFMPSTWEEILEAKENIINRDFYYFPILARISTILKKFNIL